MLSTPECITKVDELITDINGQQDALITLAHNIGANHSINAIHEIFQTLYVNIENTELSDAEFRSLTLRYLDALNDLYKETK